METIGQLITELKKKLSFNDHESIFRLLEQYLDSSRPNYDNFILIKADYNKYNDDVIKGFILYDQQRVVEATINGRLIKLFNSLHSEDIKHSSALEGKEDLPIVTYKLPIEESSFEDIYEEHKNNANEFLKAVQLLVDTTTIKNKKAKKYACNTSSTEKEKL